MNGDVEKSRNTRLCANEKGFGRNYLNVGLVNVKDYEKVVHRRRERARIRNGVRWVHGPRRFPGDPGGPHTRERQRQGDGRAFL